MKNLKLNDKFLKLKKNSVLFPLFSNFFAFLGGVFFFGSLVSLFFIESYMYTWHFIFLYLIWFFLFFNFFLMMNNKYLILAKYYDLKVMESYLKNQRIFGVFSIFNYFSKKNEIINEYQTIYLQKIVGENKNSIDKKIIVKLFFIHNVYTYVSLSFSIIVFIDVFVNSEIIRTEYLSHLSEIEFTIYFLVIPIIFYYLFVVILQIFYFNKNKKYINKSAYIMSYILFVNFFAGAFI